MPKRMTVTLADTVGEKLQAWADARGQAPATVAALAIELHLMNMEAKGELPKPKPKQDAQDSTS